MLLTLCVFLQSIHQTTNALNDSKFVTSITLRYVSARRRHPQEIIHIKRKQAQHANVGIA